MVLDVLHVIYVAIHIIHEKIITMKTSFGRVIKGTKVIAVIKRM